MCDSYRPSAPSRFGSRLEHGAAHAADHACWSRRDFMTTMGLAAAGGVLSLGGTPVRAFGGTTLLARLRALETERILVLVQLNGGNDGLNTVIPVEDDTYFNRRPGIAIPKAGSLAIPGVDDVRFHPSFDAFTPLYGEGKMAVLQSVGYPEPNLSHFRSTDIWLSGSDSEEVIETGWAGRYFDHDFPDFGEVPTDFPLAVQVGGLSSMLFQGSTANFGMSLASPELFERIAEEGILYSLDNLPATTYGSEMAFVRTVANGAFTYAGAVQAAAQTGQNRVDYPAPNPLAQNLAIVAQLIKGGLGARIYHVALGSFDTHANQVGQHGTLLRYLAEGLRAFYDDLAADSADGNVLVMTFSEFGRRVGENGSNGTDHGTAAPLFLLGSGVEGGFYGRTPSLTDLDPTGNLKYDIDFRAVYATVLQDWFGLDAVGIQTVLGGTFDTLGFVSGPATGTGVQESELPGAIALHQNYPNPFNPATTITYSLPAATTVRLRLYDARGRLVQTLRDEAQPAGTHTVHFDAGHLPSGTYYYHLETPAGRRTRSMTLVR